MPTREQLQREATKVSPAQLENLLGLADCVGDVVPPAVARMVLAAHTCLQLTLMSEGEILLIFRRWRAELLGDIDPLSTFHMVFANPWSAQAVVTCTGRAGFTNVHTGERLAQLAHPSFVTISINCTALLNAAMGRWNNENSNRHPQRPGHADNHTDHPCR